MSLYLRGGIWWMEYRKGDIRHRESTKTGDKQAALTYEIHRRKQLENNQQLPQTWASAVERWMREKSDKRSLERDRIIAKKLSGWNDKLLATITAQEIREELEKRRLESSASNANHYLAFIRALFNKSVDWGWVSTVPAIRPYKVSNRRVRFLTKEELQRLLQALPDHLAGPVEFSVLTGLRQSNVTGLRWSWVDLTTKLVIVPGEYYKNGKPHVFPISDRAAELVAREKGKHEEFVFTYKGNRIGQINNTAWKKALVRAGIKDFRWHDLRHTFASYHAMNGTPLLTLKNLGGWSTLEMVNRYAHLTAESSRGYVGNVIP